MNTGKKLIAFLLVLFLVACQAPAAQQSTSSEAASSTTSSTTGDKMGIQADLLTKVIDSGEVAYAIRLTLPSPVSATQLSPYVFSVYSGNATRNIARLYVNDTGELKMPMSGEVNGPSEKGKYIFIELNTTDVNASTFEFDLTTFLNNRIHTNYTVKQTADIVLEDGTKVNIGEMKDLPVTNVDLAGYEHHVIKGEQEDVPVYVYSPTAETTDKKALILFLHGSGERGDDNMMQLIGTDGPATFASPRFQAMIPSYVLAPQSKWDAELKGWTTEGRLKLVTDYVRQFIKDHPDIDPNRIYVTGMSNGGRATYQVILDNPDLFAAAIPICGYIDLNQDLTALVNTPMWITHAEDDATVNVDGSRQLYQRLQELGATNVHYTEYGAGVLRQNAHASWETTYNDYRIFRWLSQQKRNAE